jgi:two-component system phosphate regulon response regulator PhoB
VEDSVVAFRAKMTRERILLIEDEPDIAEVLQYNLEKEGFQVETARRGDMGLEAIRREVPDLLLLDLMLPGIDGLELTRILKRDNATSRLPIVMLTARGEEVDRIVGLELGADDYISKPFSPREVVLRVKAVLRRLQHEEGPAERLEVGGIELDVGAHQMWVRGREIPLTATEFRLLRLLMERAGRVQTRGQLLSDVWGYAEDIDSRTVDTHIRRLRRKLGPEADRIETVIGVGYRLKP